MVLSRTAVQDKLNSYITPKIDWYSAIFEDMSFNDVLRWLGLDPDVYVADFLKSDFERSQGFDIQYMFSYEGVTLSTSQYNFYGDQIDDDIFCKVIKKFKLDISGHGLDFLRSLGMYPVDDYLRDEKLIPQPFHLTRCDFAFDFINYAPGFVDTLIEYAETNHTSKHLLCLYKRTAGIKYSIRTGDQKTIYFGAPTSDRMLRVYDKRLQYIDLETGVYKKANEYDNPDSWFRIELQTRNKYAHGLCFGTIECTEGDKTFWDAILKYIYDNYCFVDYNNTTQHNREPVKFWLELLHPEVLPPIIQNEKRIQFETYASKVEKTFARNIIGTLIAMHNMEKTRQGSVQQLVNSYLTSLFDYTNPSSAKRRNAVLAKINMAECDIANSYEDCEFGFYRECGIIGFKFKL